MSDSCVGSAEDPGIRLSPRESEVLRLLAGGHTIKETAGLLKISRRSVSVYIFRARQKLGADSTIMAVVRAVQVGVMMGWKNPPHFGAANLSNWIVT